MDTSPDKFGARQFSLRKLMLWMVVIGAYLAVMRFARARPSFAAVLSVWLAVILIARIWRGVRGGVIAVSVMSVAHVCLMMSSGWRSEWGGMVVDFGVVLVSAGFIALLGISCVNAVVHVIDWLDSLGRRPAPPDSQAGLK